MELLRTYLSDQNINIKVKYDNIDKKYFIILSQNETDLMDDIIDLPISNIYNINRLKQKGIIPSNEKIDTKKNIKYIYLNLNNKQENNIEYEDLKKKMLEGFPTYGDEEEGISPKIIPLIPTWLTDEEIKQFMPINLIQSENINIYISNSNIAGIKSSIKRDESWNQYEIIKYLNTDLKINSIINVTNGNNPDEDEDLLTIINDKAINYLYSPFGDRSILNTYYFHGDKSFIDYFVKDNMSIFKEDEDNIQFPSLSKFRKTITTDFFINLDKENVSRDKENEKKSDKDKISERDFFLEKFILYNTASEKLLNQMNTIIIREIYDTVITYILTVINYIDFYKNFGNVLVHCNAGQSRSGSIIVGYIMKKKPTYSFEEALREAQTYRPIITPNNFLIYILLILKAKEWNLTDIRRVDDVADVTEFPNSFVEQHKKTIFKNWSSF